MSKTTVRIWDPVKYMADNQKTIDKLLKALKAQGIETDLFGDELNNATFTNGKKTIKMSHHSLYRFAGRCMKAVVDKKSREGFKYSTLSLDEYCSGIIKPIVETRLK